MKRLLLSLALLFAATLSANAQCVGVGGVNSVPQTGVTCASESNVDTYAATGFGIVPVASATDIACITGSATRVVRVLSIRVGGSAGTLVSLPVIITKHASANTGGTPAVTTALPVPYRMDSTDAAPTATTVAYTANPTITDATPGYLDASVLTLNVTTVAGGVPVNFTWLTHIYNEPPILRGVAQQVCVNLNGVSVSSGVMHISFLWTEQAQ